MLALRQPVIRSRTTFTLAAIAATILPLPAVPALLAYGDATTQPATQPADQQATSERVNTDKTGLALNGYDPVSYFVDDAPKKGDFQIAAKHDGAVYWFTSEANKRKFESNPEKYLPEFGGYCAFGVSLGRKFNGDPNAYLIHEGKLYLNISPAIQEKFVSDIAGYLTAAEAKWTSIRDRPAGELG
ncbi:MAG: YHS domain-containing (seleno)protein [Planctomycetota bacterium]